jgi:tetraacyldisaccharide 4'-kinase
MIRRFEDITADRKLILTTEKDAVRLIKFGQELKDKPFYVLPIEPGFLFGDEVRFNEEVRVFIESFKITIHERKEEKEERDT